MVENLGKIVVVDGQQPYQKVGVVTAEDTVFLFPAPDDFQNGEYYARPGFSVTVGSADYTVVE